MFGVGKYTNKIVTGFVFPYIQQYIKNNVDALKLSLWRGDVVLNDISLNLEEINKKLSIPSPFAITKGYIQELRCNVPWSAILTQPVKIILTGVEITLSLGDHYWSTIHKNSMKSHHSNNSDNANSVDHVNYDDNDDNNNDNNNENNNINIDNDNTIDNESSDDFDDNTDDNESISWSFISPILMKLLHNFRN